MNTSRVPTRLIAAVNFVLVIGILVLINLVAGNAYRKFDLTRNDAYSLSRVSEETLARLEDPLRVYVLFSNDLPAPYNGVRQYLTDLLREYRAAGGDTFTWEAIDVSTPEGRQQAQQYGLQQIEIQEVRSDQFQSRAVYMGAVILYGNVVERVDRLTTTDGLEYRLTAAMSSAIEQVDALAGTTEPVVMDVFASPALEELGIQGFRELNAQLAAIHERINRDNYGKIEYSFNRPATAAEIRDAAERFGVRPLRWEANDGTVREGLLEVVLHTGDQVKRIPLEIYSQLFGGYTLDDPANIEESIRQGLRGLVSPNPRIAYAVGHGEKALQDQRQGAAPLAALAGERYELLPVSLDKNDIPADIDTLIVNGPSVPYSEEALYRIDQFVMNGGSVFFLVDRYRQVIPTQQQQMMGVQPGWEENETGVEALLESYGVTVTGAFVLDEESYTARQGGQSLTLFQAPVLSGDSLNDDAAVTAGLQDVIVLNTTELLPSRDLSEDRASGGGEPVYTFLLRTSPQSWTVQTPEDVGPWIEGAPPSADLGRRDVAVLLNGTLTSHFDGPLDVGGDPGDPGNPGPERFAEKSTGDGEIIVVSSSALTTAQMLDPQNRTPNGTFVLNVLDYLSGASGIAELRSKGLGVPRITVEHPAAVAAARWGNVILVPLFVVAVGLFVWYRRRIRRARIAATFGAPLPAGQATVTDENHGEEKYD